MPDHTESILRPTLNPQPSTLKVVGHQIMEKYSSRCSWSPQTSTLNPKDYGTPDRGGKQKQVEVFLENAGGQMGGASGDERNDEQEGAQSRHGEEGQGDGTQSSLGSGHWVHVDVVNDVINAPWL
jgi:hypothetical protein